MLSSLAITLGLFLFGLNFIVNALTVDIFNSCGPTIINYNYNNEGHIV